MNQKTTALKIAKLLVAIGLFCTLLATGCDILPELVPGPSWIFIWSPLGLYERGTMALVSASFIPGAEWASVDIYARK